MPPARAQRGRAADLLESSGIAQDLKIVADLYDLMRGQHPILRR